MNPCEWRVWPWNWRKASRAQGPPPTEAASHPPDDDLRQRAELLAKRATQLLEEIKPESASVAAGVTHKAIASTQDFMQSQSCYAELARRQDLRRAERESTEALERSERDRTRENCHFWTELFVIGVLILAEIGLSLYFGCRAIHDAKEQAKVLAHMDDSAAETAKAMQRRWCSSAASPRTSSKSRLKTMCPPNISTRSNSLEPQGPVGTTRAGHAHAPLPLPPSPISHYRNLFPRPRPPFDKCTIACRNTKFGFV